MATFNFYHHAPEIEFPDDQARVRFGRNFVFATDPVVPIQRTFKLMMTGLTWTTNSAGIAIAGPDPKRCALTFYNFYTTHRLHQTFDYPVPGMSTVQARFNQPLKLPSALLGGSGVLPDFEIELIEVPA